MLFFILLMFCGLGKALAIGMPYEHIGSGMADPQEGSTDHCHVFPTWIPTQCDSTVSSHVLSLCDKSRLFKSRAMSAEKCVLTAAVAAASNKTKTPYVSMLVSEFLAATGLGSFEPTSSSHVENFEVFLANRIPKLSMNEVLSLDNEGYNRIGLRPEMGAAGFNMLKCRLSIRRGLMEVELCGTVHKDRVTGDLIEVFGSFSSEDAIEKRQFIIGHSKIVQVSGCKKLGTEWSMCTSIPEEFVPKCTVPSSSTAEQISIPETEAPVAAVRDFTYANGYIKIARDSSGTPTAEPFISVSTLWDIVTDKIPKIFFAAVAVLLTGFFAKLTWQLASLLYVVTKSLSTCIGGIRTARNVVNKMRRGQQDDDVEVEMGDNYC